MTPRLLTASEAAAYCGLSEKALRHRVAREGIPVKRLGVRTLPARGLLVGERRRGEVGHMKFTGLQPVRPEDGGVLRRPISPRD